MLFLSIFGVIISFIYGYYRPHKAMWFSIIMYPLLYPANFPIVPSSTLYLNIQRVVFFMIIGVHLKWYNKINLKILFNNSWVKIFFVYILYIIFLRVSYLPVDTFFTLIPNIYISFVLGFLIIQKDNDLKKIIKIFAWHSVFFSGVVFLDFFHITNLQLIVRQMAPRFDAAQLDLGGLRAGIYRVSGWDGEAITSSARLVALFIVGLLNIQINKNKIIQFIPPVFTFIAIVLMMTRIAYLAMFVSLFFLFYNMLKIDRNIILKIKNLFKSFIFVMGLLGLIIFFIPSVMDIATKFYEFSFSKEGSSDAESRWVRIPEAIGYFLEKPIRGYGSVEYSYSVIMNYQDIPYFVNILLAGGIPLFIAFFWWWIKMPFYYIKRMKFVLLSKEDKLIIVYFSASFLGGFFPMITNRILRQQWLLYLMFIMLYKHLLIKQNKFIIKNRI